MILHPVCDSDDVPYQYVNESDVSFSIGYLVPSGIKECHIPVRCRDYASAIMLGFHEGSSSKVYDFCIRNKKDVAGRLMVSLLYVDEKTDSEYDKAISYLNEIESIMGIEPSSLRAIYREDDFFENLYDDNAHRDILVLNINPEWLNSSLLYSLYTFLMRGFLYAIDENRSLFDHLNYLVTELDYDYRYFRKQGNGGFDFILFLKNYKVITRDHPITGIDDTILNIPDFMDRDSFQDKVNLKPVNKEHPLYDKIRPYFIRPNFTYFYENVGFLSFVNHITYVKETYETTILNFDNIIEVLNNDLDGNEGPSWVLNYLLLKNNPKGVRWESILRT